jgi:hypothetical protein
MSRYEKVKCCTGFFISSLLLLELPLEIRDSTSHHCRIMRHRDANTAKNIKKESLRMVKFQTDRRPPVVAHCNAPVVAHCNAPVVAHCRGNPPVVAHCNAPVVAHCNAPVVAHCRGNPPVVAHCNAPVVAPTPVVAHCRDNPPVVAHCRGNPPVVAPSIKTTKPIHRGSH